MEWSESYSKKNAFQSKANHPLSNRVPGPSEQIWTCLGVSLYDGGGTGPGGTMWVVATPPLWTDGMTDWQKQLKLLPSQKFVGRW